MVCVDASGELFRLPKVEFVNGEPAVFDVPKGNPVLALPNGVEEEVTAVLNGFTVDIAGKPNAGFKNKLLAVLAASNCEVGVAKGVLVVGVANGLVFGADITGPVLVVANGLVFGADITGPVLVVAKGLVFTADITGPVLVVANGLVFGADITGPVLVVLPNTCETVVVVAPNAFVAGVVPNAGAAVFPPPKIGLFVDPANVPCPPKIDPELFHIPDAAPNIGAPPNVSFEAGNCLELKLGADVVAPNTELEVVCKGVDPPNGFEVDVLGAPNRVLGWDAI